jgi:hypothetical protein
LLRVVVLPTPYSSRPPLVDPALLRMVYGSLLMAEEVVFLPTPFILRRATLETGTTGGESG